MKFDFKIMAELIFVAALLVLVCLMITSGCVTTGKYVYKTLDDLSGTPYPTPTPTAQITKIPDRVTVPAAVVSVVPIPTESKADYMDRTNGRYETDLYKFFRNNASGYQDLLIYTTVYGHKFTPTYHTWSDSWAQYFEETPRSGYQYLFVYVVVWVDMEKGNDARPYGFDKDHWRVQYNGATYEPVRYYEPAWRVKEMETVHNYNNDAYVTPYGYLIRFDNEKGWIADPLGWIKGGKSNAWDGYLIYEIPVTARPDDLKVIGRFENLGGWAWWQLK